MKEVRGEPLPDVAGWLAANRVLSSLYARCANSLRRFCGITSRLSQQAVAQALHSCCLPLLFHLAKLDASSAVEH